MKMLLEQTRSAASKSHSSANSSPTFPLVGDAATVPDLNSATPVHSAPIDLHCLDGIRALSSLGVLCFHCYIYWQLFLPYQTKYELTRLPAVKLIAAGMACLDVLLLISAALSAYQLLPNLEDQHGPPCGRVVAAYWRRRALRILPAYAVANLAAAVALGPTDVAPEAAAARWIHFNRCPANVWANVLLIQNFLGNKACAIHLWTVGLQAQWYLAYPLLLWALRPRTPGFRARLTASLAAIMLCGTLWRLWAAWQTEFLELPVADFAVDKASHMSWASMLHATYLPTASRVAELAAGAGLGALLQSRAQMLQLQKRRRWVGAAALVLQAIHLYLIAERHLLFRAPGTAPWTLATARLHIALLAWGSPFMAATMCMSLLALMLHADSIHSAAARLLGAAAWQPLASVSFTLFLMHEQARLWVVLMLPPGWLPAFISSRPLLGLAAVIAGTLAAGIACALPLHLIVERRAREAPAV